jgi:hypothetical protein
MVLTSCCGGGVLIFTGNLRWRKIQFIDKGPRWNESERGEMHALLTKYSSRSADPVVLAHAAAAAAACPLLAETCPQEMSSQ